MSSTSFDSNFLNCEVVLKCLEEHAYLHTQEDDAFVVLCAVGGEASVGFSASALFVKPCDCESELN